MGKYDHIDFDPPAGVRKEAAKGLDWRSEYNRGGTEVGVARARDLSGGKNISPETARRMASYFARHEVDKKGKGWSPGDEGYPSAGRIAWALWGGDAGDAWSSKLVKQLDAADESGKGLEDACWSGYEAVGTKRKNGKLVPNCVPKSGSKSGTGDGGALMKWAKSQTSGGTMWESKAALAAYLIKHPGADMSKHQLVKGARKLERASPQDQSIATPKELSLKATQATMQAIQRKISHYKAAEAHQAAEAAQRGAGNIKAATAHEMRAKYHMGQARIQMRASMPQTQPPTGPTQ